MTKEQLNTRLFALRKQSFKEENNDYLLFMIGFLRRQIEELEIAEVLELMTSPEILKLSEFETATPILPDNFKTYEELLCRRGSIRNLNLLPVKSNEMRDHYNSLDKNALSKELLAKITGNFLFAENEYPYVLPEGTEQYIIWVKDKNTDREKVAKFIAEIIKYNYFETSKIILFERPIGTDTVLIKGTFSEIRHIHLWRHK